MSLSRTETNYGFPDENIDPKKKLTKEWMLQYMEAAMYRYNALPTGAIGWSSRNRYDEYSLYARGSQPVEKYKRTFDDGEDGQNQLLVVDWRVLPIMSKLLTVMNGVLSELTFRPQINPIDDLAQDEMENALLENEAKILFRKEMERMGADSDILNVSELQFDEEEARDLEELAVRELGMRHVTAMELEQVVETVLNYNNFDFLFQQWNSDMSQYGVAVRKVECINKSEIRIIREDPRNLIMSYCQNPDFSDWRYVGLVRSVPCSSLIANSNGELSRKDVDYIYALGANGLQTFGFPTADWGTYNSPQDFYNKGSVWIFDCEIRTTDKKVLQKRKTKVGNDAYNYTNPEEKPQKDSEYSETYVENIYCGKWVVGTDIVFDIHKKRNMLRNEANLSKVEPSIRVYGCQMWKMMAKSRVEELISYADGIQYAYYKLQHLLNSQVPAGYAINFDALEAVDLGAGGSDNEKMSPKDLINLFRNRGIMVHRSMGVDSDGTPLGLPITPISNQFGIDLAQYWNMINTNIQLMKETLGLNDLTDGGTPNARMVSEIAKAAMGGTKNAFSDIFTNQKHLMRDMTQDIVRYCQYIVKDGNASLLSSALGNGTIKRLRNIRDIDKYLYTVSITENPTQEELVSMQEQIKIGQQNKEVYVDNVFMLDNMTNVKQKQAYLISVVKKNREMQKQEAMQMQQQNGQIQIQSAQAAEAAKQQTIQMQIQLQLDADLKRIAAEMERELTVGTNVTLEKSRIDASGRVEASEVQALGRDVNNQRDNAVKVMTAPEVKDKDKKVLDNLDDFKSAVTPRTANDQPLEIQEFDFTKQ